MADIFLNLASTVAKNATNVAVTAVHTAAASSSPLVAHQAHSTAVTTKLVTAHEALVPSIVTPTQLSVAQDTSGPTDEDSDAAPSPTRWIWWFVIAYMFYAQATICDEYFVESIKRVVDVYKIPEDVAGATLMALGCNGPELFTNMIAIFITHSDLGVGTIIGSEIFNLLCIIGGTIIFTPILPLAVEKSAFIRDCSFYGISIILLFWVLLDGQVSLFESTVLLCFCALYAIIVGFTDKIEKLVKKYILKENDLPEFSTMIQGLTPGSPSGPSLDVINSVPELPVSSSSSEKVIKRPSSGASPKKKTGSIMVQRKATQATFGMDEEVDLVTVEISRHQRFAKGRSEFKRKCTVESSSVGLKIIPEDTVDMTKSMSALTTPLLAYDMDDSRLIKWEEIFLSEITTRAPEIVLQADVPVAVPVAHTTINSMISIRLTFVSMESKQDLEEIIARKIKQVRPSDQEQFGEGAASLPVQAMSVLEEASHSSSIVKKGLLYLTLPVEILFGKTMSWCDVKLPGNQDKYAACFGMSMVWLAISSYIMCEVADIIHDEFGISTAILGITLCAIGTSFPNFFASVLIAQENRSSMAIANALGSNIQNVLLALAFPWFIRTLTAGNYAVAADGISQGIVWMAGTLALVVYFAVSQGFTFKKEDGYVMVAAYFVYLIFTIATTN